MLHEDLSNYLLWLSYFSDSSLMIVSAITVIIVLGTYRLRRDMLQMYDACRAQFGMHVNSTDKS